MQLNDAHSLWNWTDFAYFWNFIEKDFVIFYEGDDNMIMILLGIIIIALTLYDYKKTNSLVSRILKHVPLFNKNMDDTKPNHAIGISMGVFFMMIGVIAKLLPFI